MSAESDKDEESSAWKLLQDENENDKNDDCDTDLLEKDMLEDPERVRHQNDVLLFWIEQVETENKDLQRKLGALK